jgi:hypothetical protein
MPTRFYIFLTVQLHIILVGEQLEENFLYNMFIESSTCFEQPCAHPQEDNCINTSGIINLKTSEWSSGLVILVILDHSFVFRLIIPDVVLIQLSS